MSRGWREKSMKSEAEWKKFFRQEEETLGVGSPQFLANHAEIMRMIEAEENRNKNKRERRESA